MKNTLAATIALMIVMFCLFNFVGFIAFDPLSKHCLSPTNFEYYTLPISRAVACRKPPEQLDKFSKWLDAPHKD